MSNPILNRKSWLTARAEAEKDPGKYHGEIAKRAVFWFHPGLDGWIKRVDDNRVWVGFDAKTGQRLAKVDLPAEYNPWSRAFNDDDPPFYKWFQGGWTNACFNEVDVHVLEGRGDEVAFIFEGDRWDPTLNGGKGGPVFQKNISRKELLWEVAKYALVLRNLGLKKGDRIALNMPNILEQIYVIEAAKRLGIIYTSVFGGFSAKTLSDRIADSGAKVVFTVDGAHRNARVIPFKEAFTDIALDAYLPLGVCLDIVQKTLVEKQIPFEVQEKIISYCKTKLQGEITLERSDVMLEVGEALNTLQIASKAELRTAIAEALIKTRREIVASVVVRFTDIPDVKMEPSRDKWAHDLLEKAESELQQVEGSLIEKVYKAVPPVPVDAEFPLFIIYTSGSTGKPKGVVHTHGGYTAGIAYTMRVVFNVDREAKNPQVIYVVADPGWITGQSYMISASLITRTTSIITEGSPLFPHAGRFASIIERYKVNIFKAGSTFLKTIAKNPEDVSDVKKYNVSSLRSATFCAEPVNPVIQQFAMDLLTKNYSNSYWATEHGGIVFSHFFGNTDFQLAPNAHTFPLPWVFADVWVPEGEGKWRAADFDERGEIVILRPYPYLARAVWGDVENINNPAWVGDRERFIEIYYAKWPGVWAYTQGDYASKYPDDSFCLHGRSDDVINTSGHRIGTSEIEGAILKDKVLNPHSPVGNVIVVGAPHVEKETVPLAFILTRKDHPFTIEDEKRLISLVREEKGAVAVPDAFITVSQFPETRSGKYMRRLLRNILLEESLGDTSVLRNPECLQELESSIKHWKLQKERESKQKIFEAFSCLRVEYHEIEPGSHVAYITINKPPINALDERALEELAIVVEHLSRRDDIKVVVLTGAGTKSFISGADIRQLLLEMHKEEDVFPLSNEAGLVTRMIEQMNKPVIAAINGLALGGGNEFQMACHYRISEPTALFGQPEIALHLLPGYGGTQRLPRLVGLEEACKIIIGGRTVSPEKAQEIGLIHEVCLEEDVVTRATKLAHEYIQDPVNSLLGKAHKKRLIYNQKWEEKGVFPKELYDNPEIKRLIHQAKLAGREIPLQYILECLECGYANGITAGLKKEAECFARAVCNPKVGKAGIQAFFDKKTAPLPARTLPTETSDVLPLGAPFFPGVTPIPKFQYAQCVERDMVTGQVNHGDPKDAEVIRIVPVEVPKANEALVYILASEINYNDIWAITGVPVSPFDLHDQDWHTTGSGGVGLVVQLGRELKEEGRIKVGDLVALFSGKSDLLSPLAGLDPMFCDQHIQGYELPDGSHQQFMIAQGPQMFHKMPGHTLEAAGCYMLKLGTVYRALFTTLKIEPGKTIFIEGASTGTGLDAVKSSVHNGLFVTGLVSSEERAEFVRSQGAVGVINRSEFKDLFTKVPEESTEWQNWQKQGEELVAAYKKQNHGRLADYVISHAGELSFPRGFQLLAENGVMTFYGASSGYHFTFMGKPGSKSPKEMLNKASLRSGESVLIYYGTEPDSASDVFGIQCIEAARECGAKIVVVTMTDAQKEFVRSLGYGDAVRGVFSIEGLQHREGRRFSFPKTMPALPDSKKEAERFKEAVRWYQEHVFKPFATEVGKVLKTSLQGRGSPDLVIERASFDTLVLSTMVVKSFTGRIVYCEDMSNRRYSFYAPQVWMRQRRIYMPTASIFGTHLSNAYEIQATNELIDAGLLSVEEPELVPFNESPIAHQEMWENRHRAPTMVLNHALPQKGIKTKDELFESWSM
ncbi:MAG: AMP-binding protein [Verrucomicrobia bacterium]|nr:AMP-binding protein [Verrucomicrobiota bacterium]